MKNYKNRKDDSSSDDDEPVIKKQPAAKVQVSMGGLAPPPSITGAARVAAPVKKMAVQAAANTAMGDLLNFDSAPVTVPQANALQDIFSTPAAQDDGFSDFQVNSSMNVSAAQKAANLTQ